MIIGSVVSEELRWQDFGTDGWTDRPRPPRPASPSATQVKIWFTGDLIYGAFGYSQDNALIVTETVFSLSFMNIKNIKHAWMLSVIKHQM